MTKQVISPVWWLLLIALAVKTGYLLFGLPEPSLPEALSIDASYHYRWASLIASGDIFANAPYFRAPLYPFILALLLKISGNSLIFVRIIQLLAGCLTLLFTYRLAEKISNRRIAAVSLIILLLYPVMTFFEGELLLDSFFSLFALISFYYLVPDDNRNNRPILAGLFFALAALTRPVVFVFIPVVLVYFLCRGKREQKYRSGFRAAAAFLFITVMVIAPVTLINHIHSDQFILVSYQGGINFFIGNNPDADGLSAGLPPVGRDWSLDDAAYLAFKDTGHKISYAEQSRYWYLKGIKYIYSDPSGFIRLFAKKFYFLFSGHEISNNLPLEDAVFDNDFLKLLPVRLSFVLSLAVLPLFFYRKDTSRYLFLYSIVLIYGVTVSFFFVTSRFRLPLVPILAILAAIGIVSIYESIRSRRIGYRFFWGLIFAGGIYILAGADLYRDSSSNPQYAMFLRGNRSLRKGDYEGAVACFDSLCRTKPYFKNSYLNLGIANLKLGNTDAAVAAFRSELDHNHASAEAYNNIGVIFLLHRQYDSAAACCEKALNIKPYYAEAVVNYLRSAAGITGRELLNLIEIKRRDFRRFFDANPVYLLEEALYFTKNKRYAEAINNHLTIIGIIRQQKPSVPFESKFGVHAFHGHDNLLRLACYQLGYLYGLTSEYEKSIQFSRRAIELAPNMKEAYINLISGYQSIGDSRRADSVIAVYRSIRPDDF
jgi:tetratricopeptide (TPR) repeat protein